MKKNKLIWNIGADMRPPQERARALDVGLVAVDTSNGWIAGGLGFSEGFDISPQALAQQGLDTEQVTIRTNGTFKQLSRVQARLDHPDMPVFLHLLFAELSQSKQYLDAKAHDAVRGFWIYLCYLGVDQTRVFRVAHLHEPGVAKLEMMPLPAFNELVRSIVSRDMAPNTVVAAAVRKVGGAILFPAFRP